MPSPDTSKKLRGNRGKAVVVGLIEDTNIGDRILIESARYLYSLIHPEFEYEVFDLKGRSSKGTTETESFHAFFYSGLVAVKKIMVMLVKKVAGKRERDLRNIYTYCLWQIRKQRAAAFFETKLKDTDLIIFGGGGIIEYEHYDCYLHLDLITTIAEKYSIPILYNAVGFNGNIRADDFRYKLLYGALNSGQVKYISVREYPEKLQRILGGNAGFNIRCVCDSAVWSREAFGINTNSGKERMIIGVNVIRPQIFNEHGCAIAEEDVYRLYSNIINELERRNLRWQLFTNGVDSDYAMGECLLNKLGIKDENAILPVTNNPAEYLQRLTVYAGCICARMHASICCYSLKIPTVSLSWNEKINHFYSAIGYSGRCFSPREFEAVTIVDRLQSAIADGYDRKRYDEYRDTVKTAIRESITVMESR